VHGGLPGRSSRDPWPLAEARASRPAVWGRGRGQVSVHHTPAEDPPWCSTSAARILTAGRRSPSRRGWPAHESRVPPAGTSCWSRRKVPRPRRRMPARVSPDHGRRPNGGAGSRRRSPGRWPEASRLAGSPTGGRAGARRALAQRRQPRGPSLFRQKRNLPEARRPRRTRNRRLNRSRNRPPSGTTPTSESGRRGSTSRIN
jgi:hypothetical protein